MTKQEFLRLLGNTAKVAGQLARNIWERLPLLGTLEPWRIFVTGVSFITTTVGTMALYDTFAGSGEASFTIRLLRILIPLAGAGGCHVVIYRRLHAWRQSRFQFRYLKPVLLLQAVAVLLSANTHWLAMRGSHETTEAYAAEQTQDVRAIEDFRNSYRLMAEETGNLAEYSKDQAKNEESGRGDSCGQAVGAKRLYRYRLRMSDKTTYVSFSKQISVREKRLAALLDNAEALTAKTADEGMDKLGNLRRVVDEAAGFQSDPLLTRLKEAANTRIALGEGPIPIPPSMRRRGGPATFTCPDSVLKTHLVNVVTAIAGLKPLPQVHVADARDPQTGMSVFVPRLFYSLVQLPLSVASGARTAFFPPSRAELVSDRKSKLAAGPVAPPAMGLHSEDWPPVAIAFFMETLLLAMFRWGGDSRAPALGTARLRDMIAQRPDSTVEKAWFAVGGTVPLETMRTLLHSYVQYDDKGVLIFAPLESNTPEDRSFHLFMEMLSQAGLARRRFTGSWLKWAFGLLGGGARSSNPRLKGRVRVYQMTDVDYLELIRGAERPGKPPPG